MPPLVSSAYRPLLSNAQRDAVYAWLNQHIDCGPFDGGCLLFAQALQCLKGGDVFVVEGRAFCGWARFKEAIYGGPLIAQHAVLRLPSGEFADASGVFGFTEMLAAAADEMKFFCSAEALRPYQVGDLLEATFSEELVTSFAERLKELGL